MSKHVLTVIEDLLFTVKINDAAKKAGMRPEFVKSAHDALEKARTQPSLIVIDLNCHSIDVLKLIGDLKADEEIAKIPVIGFVSHVQGDLKKQAQDAGCDTVLARSAFSMNLNSILARY